MSNIVRRSSSWLLTAILIATLIALLMAIYEAGNINTSRYSSNPGSSANVDTIELTEPPPDLNAEIPTQWSHTLNDEYSIGGYISGNKCWFNLNQNNKWRVGDTFDNCRSWKNLIDKLLERIPMTYRPYANALQEFVTFMQGKLPPMAP